MPDHLTPNNLTIRHSELCNQLVIDYDTLEEVGTLDNLLIDVKRSQVEGLVCKSGLLGRQKQTFAWVNLAKIGQDSILLKAATLLTETASAALAAAQPIVGLEVWTDAGNRVGYIADFQLHRETGTIGLYLFAFGNAVNTVTEELQELTSGLYGLAPEAILSAGRKRIMVTEQAIDQAQMVAPGLKQKLSQKTSQAADFLQADYDQTQQDWQALVENAQIWKDKLQQQTQKLSGYTQENLPEVTQQLQAQSQKVRQQVQKQVTHWADRLKSGPAKGLFNTPSNQRQESADTIDIQAFEVWEEDESP
jgi:sporulation protein YlmC with PRC-barrel domain